MGAAPPPPGTPRGGLPGVPALGPPPGTPRGGLPGVPALGPPPGTPRGGLPGVPALGPPPGTPRGGLPGVPASSRGAGWPIDTHAPTVSARRRGVPAPGEVVGGYHLVAELGRGCMGRVFRARDPAGRDVALKVILPDQADEEGLARFRREGVALAAIRRHRNVVAVHAAGVDGGLPYLALDLVEGEPLDRALARGPLPLARALALATALARALEHVHQAGVLHRDLKPANVLVRAEDGEPVLTDFGLAGLGGADRLTRTGDLLGTPLYMAPEQIVGRHDEVDARTDVWALGVVLHELLTGQRPFDGAGLAEVSQRIVGDDPAPPSRARPEVPSALDAVVARALAKRPTDRFASAGALAAALEEAAAAPAPATRPPRRGRALAAALAVALAALGGAAGALAAGRAREVPAPAAPRAAAAPPDAPGGGEASRDDDGGAAGLARFAPLFAALDRGDVAAALAWVVEGRAAPALEAASGAAGAALEDRLAARAADPGRGAGELVAELDVLVELRKRFARAGAARPDRLAAALVERLDARARDHAARHGGAHRAPLDVAQEVERDVVVPLERLAALTPRLPDRPRAERLLEQVWELFAQRVIREVALQRALEAAVRLDVDVLDDYLLSWESPPARGRDAAAEYLAARYDAAQLDGARLEGGPRVRGVRKLEALLTTRDPSRALGPVSRARGWVVVAEGARTWEAQHEHARRAAAEDPESPWAQLRLALCLVKLPDRADDARAGFRRTLALLAERGFHERNAMRQRELPLTFLRDAGEVLVEAGRLDDAAALCDDFAGHHPEGTQVARIVEDLRTKIARARR